MNISMRRMRARLSLIQGKVKLGLSFGLVLLSVVLADYYCGIFSIILEKDFETDFSWNLDVPDFRSLIENFKNGEAVEYEPINRLYTKPRFLEKADLTCSDFQLMIILVKSAPSNIDKRRAVRSTWGNAQYLTNISNFLRTKKAITTQSNNKRHNVPRNSKNNEPNVLFKLVFLIGLLKNHEYGGQLNNSEKTKFSPEAQINYSDTLKDSLKTQQDFTQQLEEEIREESNLHNDIVRIDSIDSYTNNTLKTMMAIRYLEEVCTDYEYALLVDDDMYISIKNLLRFLEAPAAYPDGETDTSGSETIGQIVDLNRLFAGKVLFSKPIRQRIGFSSKWYLSLDEYPYNYFPRYMPTGAIVMSKQVVEDFYYASYYTKHFRFDDVFLGIMAHKMNIIPFSCSYFHVCHSSDGKCSVLLTNRQREKAFLEGPDEEDNIEELSVIDQMEHVIARHGLSTEQLLDMWRELTVSGRN